MQSTQRQAHKIDETISFHLPGFYSVAVPRLLPFNPSLGSGGGIGDRGQGAPPLRFAVTNRNNIITLDFQREVK